MIPLAALALANCGLTEFDVTQKGSAQIAGGGVIGSVLNAFPSIQGFNDFDISQSQEFKNENAHKDHVSSAKLTSFSIQITAPDDEDFQFLDSIAFYAEANGQKVRVAHKENIRSLGLKAPNPTLNLDLDDVELAPFVKADAMSVTAEAQAEQPVEDTTLTASAVIHVGVSL